MMTEEDFKILNRAYMPYVSRARLHQGPTLLQAVGPALLTTKWEQNSIELRDTLIERFGREIALDAIQLEYEKFLGSKATLKELIKERYERVYKAPIASGSD